MKDTLIERFWSKVDTSSECWLWTGTRNKNNYGVITIEKQTHYAARIAYELTYNTPPPPRIDVRHTCGNSLCVRPGHLFLNQRAERMADEPRLVTVFLDTPRTSGTYAIVNSKNGKVYIGVTSNFQVRFRIHYSQLMNGNHHNELLQADWDLFTPSAFTFSILESPDLVEARYVEQYHSDNPSLGYNLHYFDKLPHPAKKQAEKIEALARAWGINSKHFYHKTITQCIDMAYAQVFADENNTAPGA